VSKPWKPPVTLEFMERVEPIIQRRFALPVAGAATVIFKRYGIKNVTEGMERIQGDPQVICYNHVHFYDWLPIRYEIWRQLGHMGANFVKPRPYQKPAVARFLGAAGCVPLISRGYLITADFQLVHGRKADETEYRWLRNVVDGRPNDGDAPATVGALLTSPRDLVGRTFNPSTESYADAVNETFRQFTFHTTRLIRRAMDQGAWPLINPQGTFHSKLTPGRIGAVQFASALGTDILPVGVSGMATTFPDPHSLKGAPGTNTVRFGAPMSIKLPDDHVVFDKKSETKHQAVLASETRRVMDRINELIDPELRWGDNPDGDGLQGVDRFL
jgi:1-acyl-sn-glycerol-3-phosphate acyltransferase